MTAGSGIIHQEMPQASKRLFGAQLWLNLSAKNKMVTPKYHDIKAEKVPAVQKDGCTVKIIGGTYQGTTGAMTSQYAETLYLDVDIPADKEWSLDLQQDDTLFVYILQGGGKFEGDHSDLIFEKHAVLFEKGEKMTVRGGNDGIRFLLLSGKPLKEPIAWGGPIVMNTQEELSRAFQELDEGTFIKK
jgi:redox-sensitive bicupin YhaK (pirin superfamily)